MMAKELSGNAKGHQKNQHDVRDDDTLISNEKY